MAAYRLTREEPSGIVLIQVHQPLTVAQWTECLARVITAGWWSDPTLYDLSDPAADLPAPDHLRMLPTVEELNRRHGVRGPVAFVYPDSAKAARATAWLMSVRAGVPYPMEIFADAKAARAWLKKSHPTARKV